MAEPTAKNEQACAAAQQQALHDMPYVNVGEAKLYKKVETFGEQPRLSVQGVRWYVEVDVQHWYLDQGEAVVLYRVWRRADGNMAAVRVDIREKESE